MRTDNQDSLLGFELERLERRQMLAGNVDVIVNAAGDLIVNGDAEGNRLSIRETNGQIVLQGGDGTTVNGDSELAIDPNEVTGDFRINLRGGDNSLSMDYAIPGDLVVKTQGGHDLISLDMSAENVTIKTGGGDDEVELTSESANKVLIATGGGNDEICVVGSVLDDAIVRAGGGDDFVRLNTMDVGDRLLLKAGGGADDVFMRNNNVEGRATAALGGGEDVIEFENGSYSSLLVNGNGGFDTGSGSGMESHWEFRSIVFSA